MKLSRNYLIVVLILIAFWLLFMRPKIDGYSKRANGTGCNTNAECVSNKCRLFKCVT